MTDNESPCSITLRGSTNLLNKLLKQCISKRGVLIMSLLRVTPRDTNSPDGVDAEVWYKLT